MSNRPRRWCRPPPYHRRRYHCTPRSRGRYRAESIRIELRGMPAYRLQPMVPERPRGGPWWPWTSKRVTSRKHSMSITDASGVSPLVDAGDAPGDEIVRCVLEGLPVRVVAATTSVAVREAARRHQAGPAATLALSRGLTAN